MIKRIPRIALAIAIAILVSSILMAAAPLSPIAFDVTPDAQGKTARVGVVVRGDYSKVEAKTVQSAKWTDITRSMSIIITENCTVYVQVTDTNGNISAKSEYLYTSIRVVATPQEEPAASRPSSKPSGSGTATASPPAAATDPEPVPPDEIVEIPEPVHNPAPPAPVLDAEAEGNTVNNVVAVGNKQFITIETRDEKIFYLIIDGDKGSDNVYLVLEASTKDLLSFAEDGQPGADADTDTLIDGGALPSDNEIIVGETVPSDGESSGTSDNPDDGDKKANPIPGIIVIVLLVLIAAFAGYMFLVVLPRKKKKEAFADSGDEDEDEDGYDDEEYEDDPEETYEPVAGSPNMEDEDSEDENPLEAFDDDEDYPEDTE